MNAAQIVDAIHRAQYTGEKHGLDNTRALLDQLHIPHTPVPILQVAGTNGKGSVCAMAESALRLSGMKTGLYTSPFLQKYNERIRLNGHMVSDELLEQYGNPVLEAAETLKREKNIYPASFELGTALAFSIFYHEKVDCAVVEVGLGGRLDPTNVLTPRVSVIAKLGLDHTYLLGDTLPKIAGEKAGIIKPGVPVAALKPENSEAAAVIENRAKELNAPLTWADSYQVTVMERSREGSRLALSLTDQILEVSINLPGDHQGENALLAAAALKLWGLSDQEIIAGLEAAQWPARLEWCGNLLLDGAHNAQGAQALLRFVNTHLADEKKVLLTGVLEEKLEDEMLKALAALADQAVTVTPNSPRALTGEKLGQLLAQHGCASMPCKSVLEGLAKARNLAGNDGIIICAGSLYLAGEMRTLLGLEAD